MITEKDIGKDCIIYCCINNRWQWINLGYRIVSVPNGNGKVALTSNTTGILVDAKKVRPINT